MGYVEWGMGGRDSHLHGGCHFGAAKTSTSTVCKLCSSTRAVSQITTSASSFRVSFVLSAKKQSSINRTETNPNGLERTSGSQTQTQVRYGPLRSALLRSPQSAVLPSEQCWNQKPKKPLAQKSMTPAETNNYIDTLGMGTEERVESHKSAGGKPGCELSKEGFKDM